MLHAEDAEIVDEACNERLAQLRGQQLINVCVEREREKQIDRAENISDVICTDAHLYIVWKLNNHIHTCVACDTHFE